MPGPEKRFNGTLQFHVPEHIYITTLCYVLKKMVVLNLKFVDLY